MVDGIECSLEENALDYLLFAGELAKQGTAKRLKHAMANLADGIELLLKARLEVKDWHLVVGNKNITHEQYQTGDFFSVKPEKAIELLESECEIFIDSQVQILLKQLREHRNKVRHFKISVIRSIVLSLITQTYSFALEFIADNFEDSGDSLSQDLLELKKLLGDFETFVSHRMEDIRKDLDSTDRLVKCPACLQDTLYADGEVATCIFCRTAMEGKKAARRWVNAFIFKRPKAEAAWPSIDNCGECGAEACVDVSSVDGDETSWFCFSCGQGEQFERCKRCDCLHTPESFDDEPSTGVCSDCMDDVMRDDD
jgi:hypothetical protein